MATTIKSTALDFDNIKSNLKTFLASKNEFTDYDFESSALSNVLDVLAYNTHMNALLANFALNESYLGTAQLRSSVVSLAEGIGYTPDTATSAAAVVNVSLTTNNSLRPATIELPAYTKFTATINDSTYTFQTLEDYTATDDGTGFYQFRDNNESKEVTIREGLRKTKTFLVSDYDENPVYIIPDATLDADTVTVTVYPQAIGGSGSIYTNVDDATNITSQSTIYLLREAPNGYFELSFGDGKTFGVAPEAGSRIVLDYLSTKGAEANGGNVFNPKDQFAVTLTDDTTLNVDLSVITATKSTGGDSKESIESIRLKAPFQYASQNRMVTADDYSSLILRKYSTLIKDIKAWGGEENLEPEYGAVFVSIDFEDDVSALTQSNTKIAILDLADQLSVISFNLRFTDPVTTYIEVKNFFQFNPKLTTLTLNTIQTQVLDKIDTYFDTNTGKFEQAFRRSNMLTDIDEVSSAVLSSRAEIRMQQRFNPVRPTLIATIESLANNSITDDQINHIIKLVNENKYDDAATYMTNIETVTSPYSTIRTTLINVSRDNNIVLRFPGAIAEPDDENYRITSTTFTYLGNNCKLQNVLKSNQLQIVATNDNRSIVDNAGSYNAATGVVTIKDFTPTATQGNLDYIKVSVVPANESAIAPTRNNILEYDRTASFARGVITSATN